MSTSHPDLFAALAAPFHPSEVRTRSQGGRDLRYVTARTVMHRLDAVLGPENWRDEYRAERGDAVVCRLWVRLPDGEWLAKEDCGLAAAAAAAAGKPGAADPVKSAYSDALKRAAVRWGVGRYLYGDAPPPPNGHGNGHGNGAAPRPRDGDPSQARPPSTPEPDRVRPPLPDADRMRPHPGRGYTPGHGRELIAWARKQDAARGVQCVRWLSEWGRRRGYPDRLVDWSGDQVAQGHAAATAKLLAREREVSS